MKDAIWYADHSGRAFPALFGDIKTDVLIIGGGLAGLLCASRLTKNGTDCVVLEADRIGCGTSGKTTGKITSQHGLLYGNMLKTRGGGDGSGLLAGQ